MVGHSVDTAYAYGNGKSETRVGKVVATRRKEVWVATRIADRTRDGFHLRLIDFDDTEADTPSWRCRGINGLRFTPFDCKAGRFS